MAFRDPRAEAWGRATEIAVRDVFQKRGRFLVPAHLIDNGGAPMLVGLIKRYVLPDFLQAGKGQSRWLEVKFKDHPAIFQKTGFFRHGIDLPKFRDYLMVEKETGIPGDIAILQYRRGAEGEPAPFLLIQSFSHLKAIADRVSKPTPSAPHGMVYWNVDEMDCICPLDFDARNLPIMTHKINLWEQRGQNSKAPQMRFENQQRSLFSPRPNDTVK